MENDEENMRPYELECEHGVGHSSYVHGCDGCCGKAFNVENQNKVASYETIMGLRDNLLKIRDNDMVRGMNGSQAVQLVIDTIERAVEIADNDEDIQ